MRITRTRHTAMMIFVVLLLLLPEMPVQAQEGETALALRLRRDFGYGSGAQMQGRFSYRVEAPETVKQVEFLLDGEVIAVDTEAPYRLPFATGDYADGWHTLSAIGYTAENELLRSNTLRRQFVPQTQTLTYLGAISLLVLVFIGTRYLITRPRSTDATGKQRRSYGFLGGAVCPRCGKPFALQLWSVNLMAGRIARCPHCGKWSFVQRAAPETLAQAEVFERELDAEAVGETDTRINREERLRRRLDDSRYDDAL